MAELSQNDITSITEEVVDGSLNELQQVVKPSIQEIKQAAKDFLNTCNGLAAAYERGNQIIQKGDQMRHAMQDKDKSQAEIKALLKENKEYQEQKQEFKAYFQNEGMKIYEALFKFQDVLNAALGQKVQMVYVATSRSKKNIKPPVVYEVSEEQVLRNLTGDSTRGTLVGRINLSKKLLKQEENRVLNALNDNSDRLANGVNLANLDSAYSEVIWRYRHSRGKFILYKNETPPPKWLKLSISGEGDINEAYANVVLSRQVKSEFLFTESSLEHNVGTFAKVIHLVDNISRMLQGDITVGNIEYAVKSPRAGTPGVQQFIDIAEEIINNADFSVENLQKLKKELQSKGSLRNIIEAALDGEVDSSLQDIENSAK